MGVWVVSAVAEANRRNKSTTTQTPTPALRADPPRKGEGKIGLKDSPTYPTYLSPVGRGRERSEAG